MTHRGERWTMSSQSARMWPVKSNRQRGGLGTAARCAACRAGERDSCDWAPVILDAWPVGRRERRRWRPSVTRNGGHRLPPMFCRWRFCSDVYSFVLLSRRHFAHRARRLRPLGRISSSRALGVVGRANFGLALFCCLRSCLPTNSRMACVPASPTRWLASRNTRCTRRDDRRTWSDLFEQHLDGFLVAEQLQSASAGGDHGRSSGTPLLPILALSPRLPAFAAASGAGGELLRCFGGRSDLRAIVMHFSTSGRTSFAL